MLMEGGKVIASGTYGCILKPALPCKGETDRPENVVSKLMFERYANEEMDEIKQVLRRVKKVPNYTKYYILDKIKLCRPSMLEPEDLKDFKKRCNAMTRKGVSESNVNNSTVLDQLRLLQLPDGGKDIFTYFANKQSPELVVKVNNAIILLLIGGIVPLSANNVLHQDIKSTNIVYSVKNDEARLIDWGLSTSIIGNKVPEGVRGWPVMFNQPFTNLLFHREVIDWFNNFRTHRDISKMIADNPDKNLRDLLYDPLHRVLMRAIFTDEKSINDTLGSLGHIRFLESLLKNINDLKSTYVAQFFSLFRGKKSYFQVLASIICDHLTLALLEYSITDNQLGAFAEQEFFNQVYRHNCDIFGFISCYVDIFNNKHMPKSVHKKAYEIIVKYLLDSTFAVLPFPIKEVIQDCHSINNFLMPGIKHEMPTLQKAPAKKAPAKKAPAKKAPAKKALPLMVVQSTPMREDAFTLSLSKRCPKGTRRNKKTGKCEKTGTQKKEKKRCPPGTRLNPKTGRCNKIPTAKKRKRCPKGTRRNPKTGKCDPK